MPNRYGSMRSMPIPHDTIRQATGRGGPSGWMIGRAGMDDAEWTLRVRATDADRATVYVRGRSFVVGAPAQFDERYDEVAAVEYVLAAVGGDLVNGFRLAARRRRLPVADVEAVVGGALGNPLVYLG